MVIKIVLLIDGTHSFAEPVLVKSEGLAIRRGQFWETWRQDTIV